jgi:uncharacterized protein YpiB (UPF0302 family)
VKKDTSYGNFMKEKAQEKQRKSEQFFLSLAANLVLDELFIEKNKIRLMDQIDEALKNNDYESFVELSNQYKKYC